MTSHLERLALAEFRSYRSLDVALAPGRIGFVGSNGVGKTNILEAVAWLATGESFRGAPNSALVHHGADRGQIQGWLDRDGRTTSVLAELPTRGAARVTVNGKRLARLRDLLGHLRVTVFSPDDLALVKEGPGERRSYLDRLTVALDPRHDRLLGDVERILRHRAALLRDAGGRLRADVSATLEVWDQKLAPLAETLGRLRAEIVDALAPLVADAYHDIAPSAGPIAVDYRTDWRDEPYAEVLARTRNDDLRRAATTRGPHRDELDLSIGELPARTHRSQGEQRTLALALRLAQHRLVTTAAPAPILLLDDVFSELDPARCEALIAHLPAGQALISSAIPLPSAIRIEQSFEVLPSSVREVARHG